MKKILAISFAVATFSISGSAIASSHQTGIATPVDKPLSHAAPKMPSSMIDDIEVPFEVLNYAQMEYQGYAVTQARRASRAGKQAYSLRVDRDTLTNDYESFYLLYDMEWKLLGQEKIAPPPPPPPPEEAKPKPEEQTNEKPEKPTTVRNVEEEEEGGMGGEDPAAPPSKPEEDGSTETTPDDTQPTDPPPEPSNNATE